MLVIYKTLADLKTGSIFKIIHNSVDELFVLTNKYIINEESPHHKICECVSLKDGDTRRFLDTIRVSSPRLVRLNTGRWKKVYLSLPLSDSTREAYCCSECNLTFDSDTNYCPNCGANMNNEMERIINALKDTKDMLEMAENYNKVFGYHITN